MFALLTTVWPEPHPARSTSVNLAAANRQAFASLSYLVDPQALHNRHIGRQGFLVSKNTHPRPAFRRGRHAAVLSHRIAKDAPDDPDILSLRHDCPTLAGVSGKWSLLDGMSTIATGSFLAEPARSRHLFTAFPPGIPCACSSPRSIVTWTPPAARPCVRAIARAAGRAVDGLPGAHDRIPER